MAKQIEYNDMVTMKGSEFNNLRWGIVSLNDAHRKAIRILVEAFDKEFSAEFNRLNEVVKEVVDKHGAPIED